MSDVMKELLGMFMLLAQAGETMIKDLTVMFILAHSVQSSLYAFFRPAPHPDSDCGVVCACWRS
jgi:hypothetical protein